MAGIVLKINDRFRNRKVFYFNEFSFNLKYNSIGSQFSFKFFFDPENIEHKELSCVTHFHEVTIEQDGDLLLTGIITNQSFMNSKVKTMASFGGYSLPGVLEDCQIPPRLYPLQSDGLSLKQIAQKLVAPFKLGIQVDPSVESEMNSSFKTVTASETQSIKDYIDELAKQKDIIVSHNEKGELLFTRSKTDLQPIMEFDLVKGESIPGTKFTMEYDGQQMHSHITMMRQASSGGGNAGEFTIRNPYVIGSVYRPKVKTQSSGDDNDTKKAARRELSNELKNIKLTIETDRWRINGKILKPNNVIAIRNYELYLYRKENWFIESINFTGDNKSTTATLNCVLPECYNDSDVISYFRSINLHALDE